MKRRLARVALGAVAAVSLSLSACSDRGALNQVSFGKACATGETCLADLGAPLAVGASQELAFELDISGSTAPELSLEAVAPDVLAVDGRTLTGKSKGVSAVLVNGPEDVVVDFIHVSVEEPDGVRLVRYGSDGTRKGPLPEVATLLAGDEVLVGVECVKDGEALAGTMPATWSGMSDAITVVPALEPDRYRLVARQSGNAKLVAQAGSHEASFSVEVMP